MQWTKIIIDTSPEGIGPVGGMLEDIGISGIIIEDEKDFTDFLETNRRYWDYVDDELIREKRGVSRIIFYLDSCTAQTVAEIKAALPELKRAFPGVDLGPLFISTGVIESEDWENNWKQYYKPLAVGEKLIIIPSWENDTDTGGRTAVFLDPGMSFGTGSHASTRLCLSALEQNIAGGMSVLDLGCGSGILSISALKLGAESAVACDIDPMAKDIACSNAALNGILKDRYKVYSGDILKDEALKAEAGKKSYDIVLANIVADVIIPLSYEAGRYMRPGGFFICSGIINERADDVYDALTNNGFRLVSKSSEDGWTAFTVIKQR